MFDPSGSEWSPFLSWNEKQLRVNVNANRKTFLNFIGEKDI